MKKNVIKTAFAAVCVVAAGLGGLKAYNAANQSQVDMLLAQNVEAISKGDCTGKHSITAEDYLSNGDSSSNNSSSNSKDGSTWSEIGTTTKTSRGTAYNVVCTPCPSGTFICTIGETGYKFK